MIRILRRRYPIAKVLLLPVRVQGVEAPPEIVGAIRYANRWQLADVLITGRGGGSLEDLWAFNDERVGPARSTTRKIPVISAVGHEPDVAISGLCGRPAGVYAVQRGGDRRTGHGGAAARACRAAGMRMAQSAASRPASASRASGWTRCEKKRVLTESARVSGRTGGCIWIIAVHRLAAAGQSRLRGARRTAALRRRRRARRPEPTEGARPRATPMAAERQTAAVLQSARRGGRRASASRVRLGAGDAYNADVWWTRRTDMAVEERRLRRRWLRLEQIVTLLEKGDVPAERTALALFEEGTELAAQCRKELDSAEQKVVQA